ncbi:MAG: isochorismatase family cysteine hydrolase [Ilumatobacteraceae bacterium]
MTTAGDGGPHDGWRQYALLLIDLQHDFWPDEVAAVAPSLPDRVAELLAYARSHGLLVVHVRAGFDAEGDNWMARYRLRGRIPCTDGTPGAETLPFAAEFDGEPVVVKHSFDGFLNTDLHQLLTSRGIRGLLVGGLITSTCVLFTAATATQLGYLVTVLDDCCADFEEAHTTTLAGYQFIFDAVPSTEIVDHRQRWDEQLQVMHPHG